MGSGGRLYVPSLGWFGVQQVLVIGPDKPRGPEGHLTI